MEEIENIIIKDKNNQQIYYQRYHGGTVNIAYTGVGIIIEMNGETHSTYQKITNRIIKAGIQVENAYLMNVIVTHVPTLRSSLPEVFLRKSVLKMCSKFTGEHPCWSLISIKLQSNFIEIAFRHGYSPINLLHIFRTSFSGNTSGWLHLNPHKKWSMSKRQRWFLWSPRRSYKISRKKSTHGYGNWPLQCKSWLCIPAI